MKHVFASSQKIRVRVKLAEWHADANFCRAPSFMLDRMQDPDNFEDFRHAGMPPLLNPSFERLDYMIGPSNEGRVKMTDVSKVAMAVVRLEFPDRGLPRRCDIGCSPAEIFCPAAAAVPMWVSITNVCTPGRVLRGG